MKTRTLLFAAGVAAILLSGKKKKRSAPSIPEETQEEPEIEVNPDPDPDPEDEEEGEDPLKDYVEDLFKFKCKRMLYNGYCIETLEGTPSAWYAAWSLKIRDADGAQVYSRPASFDSEAEALDYAYSKINGWT